MIGRLKGIEDLRPTARQLAEYCGETGFEEVRFSMGRGRPSPLNTKVFTSEHALGKFLLRGGHTRFRAIKAKIPNQSVKVSATVEIMYDDYGEWMTILSKNENRQLIIFRQRLPRV